jgi:hypothetical protein
MKLDFLNRRFSRAALWSLGFLVIVGVPQAAFSQSSSKPQGMNAPQGANSPQGMNAPAAAEPPREAKPEKTKEVSRKRRVKRVRNDSDAAPAAVVQPTVPMGGIYLSPGRGGIGISIGN